MVKIEYGNNRDIGNIYFAGGWVGILYFDTTPKAGDIKYISNVEMKNGIEIPKSKIVQHVHSIRFVASETMIDVLEKLPLLSNVTIKVDDFSEEKVYNLKFEIVSWLGGGAYGQCRLTYVVNTYVNKNASI
jgi:hypothetical protein